MMARTVSVETGWQVGTGRSYGQIVADRAARREELAPEMLPRSLRLTADTCPDCEFCDSWFARATVTDPNTYTPARDRRALVCDVCLEALLSR